MKSKLMKVILLAAGSVLATAVLLMAAMFIRQAYLSQKINDDYSSVLDDADYQTAVSVPDVHFITQEISCGYAAIEMLANWQGKNITERMLFDDNGGTISTAMGDGFLNEMTKQFPEWTVARHTYLSNSELLRTVYQSLAAGMPVPVELAAQRDTDSGAVWTLHIVVVTGMDLAGDAITVQNPYGYEEAYSVNDFLSATRFDSYEGMEWFLRLGFAFGVFQENSVYIIDNL
jgi:hypothetical protein